MTLPTMARLAGRLEFEISLGIVKFLTNIQECGMCLDIQI